MHPVGTDLLMRWCERPFAGGCLLPDTFAVSACLFVVFYSAVVQLAKNTAAAEHA